MDIQLDKKGTLDAVIKITLKESDYQPKVDEKIKDYAKRVNLKGFRPGKAPISLVKKMYGKSVLIDEVNNLLATNVSNYIRDNKINILGEPLPVVENADTIDWDTQKDFSFEYKLGLAPEFEVELSEKIKVTNYEIEVDKKSLDETIENIRAQFGGSTNPEVVADGDLIQIDFSNSQGFTFTKYIEKSEVAEKEYKKFVGKKSGDTLDVVATKLFSTKEAAIEALELDNSNESIADEKLTAAISNITRREPAELNQEFFDKIFGPGAVSTEAEFVEKVKITMSDNYAKDAGFLFQRDLKKTLLETFKIELPEAFLKEWLVKTSDGKVKQSDVDAEFELYAEEMKWNLIKQKIAQVNDIKVETPEVIEQAKEYFRAQFGGMALGPEFDDTLTKLADNFLKAENGDNFMKLFNEVRDTKVIDLVREKIKLNNKKVDIEGFKKAIESK